MEKINKQQENIYNQLIKEIVDRQMEIIGPLAVSQAKTVNGMSFTGNEVVIVEGFDGKKVLGDLVKAYSNIFGKVSIEVCKEAVKDLKDIDEKYLPEILI